MKYNLEPFIQLNKPFESTSTKFDSPVVLIVPFVKDNTIESADISIYSKSSQFLQFEEGLCIENEIPDNIQKFPDGEVIFEQIILVPKNENDYESIASYITPAICTEIYDANKISYNEAWYFDLVQSPNKVGTSDYFFIKKKMRILS